MDDRHSSAGGTERERPEAPAWADAESPPDEAASTYSPYPAVALAFVGGGLALADVSIQHWPLAFGACGCLLASWYLARFAGPSPGEDEAADENALSGEAPEPIVHPLAKRSTQTLLLALALITGAVGIYRVMHLG
ncbi:MAG: hypothetical protein GY778_06065 [bacterium]|nr:hypothetical protein [bacterium]